MENLSKTLTSDNIEKIAKADDFHIAPLRADGKIYGTPIFIWSVSVGGNLYCRAYSGVDSSWYKAAVTYKEGKIKALGLEKIVRFEAEKDAEINSLIEAYRIKYKWDEYLDDMVGKVPKNATVKVISGE
ncbi:DUF2255 family protein [Elizabethkingia argentiflava]|uniref:DUF2255 family protein n=1 Tax=Elizabethkingia argenteiflava TaxID=2681556 RepID=A0A845PWS6_9FLAO|nr:DUF2255 family protein [Elizabethkingia argenteiflava]NAW51411.1 DUF2255 family protein [Elizabethkingia argenteiflava]